MTSNRNPLDLIERDHVGRPVIELGRARALMRGHGLSVLERAASLEACGTSRLRQCEGITAKHVDMVEAQRGQAGDVFITNVVSAGAKLVQRRIHINRVPEHDDVDHEAEGAELVFLAFAIALIEWYLDRSRCDFGILTNGRLWRLVPRDIERSRARFITLLTQVNNADFHPMRVLAQYFARSMRPGA
jgi:hypothetical protein